MTEAPNFKEAFDVAKKNDGKIDEQETADLVKKLASYPNTKAFITEIATKKNLEKWKVVESTRQAWESLNQEVRTSIQELIWANKDWKIGKETILKLEAALNKQSVKDKSKDVTPVTPVWDLQKTNETTPATTAWENVDSNSESVTGWVSSNHSEEAEKSEVTYKLESEAVIKNAMLNFNNLFESKIIWTYINEDEEVQNILLKSSWNWVAVELDGTWTLNDSRVKAESIDYTWVKNAAEKVVSEYKRELQTKQKEKEQKTKKEQQEAFEREKEVWTYDKIDWTKGKIMLFRYENNNIVTDVPNASEYRYELELDKSDKNFDPSINFDHKPTDVELKTAIDKLTTEYKTYVEWEKKAKAELEASKKQSEIEKQNKEKVDSIIKDLSSMKINPEDLMPDTVDKKFLTKWTKWLWEFAQTDVSNWISLDINSVDLSKNKVDFEFNDFATNESFNKWLTSDILLVDWKVDKEAFKKSIKMQMANVLEKIK